MNTRENLLHCSRITVIAVAALGVGAFGQQTTRPAGEPADAALATLKINVWTCTDHDQFRLRQSGTCPVCEQDLVRKQVTLQGGEQRGDLYPLETCPVSGLRLGEMGPPIAMMHEGREVRLCCAGCIKKFEASPDEYWKQIDQKIVEQQKPHYPLTVCPISLEELGSMGKPVDHVYRNRLVRFCCKGCVRTFKKDPAEALAELDRAILASQTLQYPVESCPISRMKLGSMGKPVDYVVANRLVRFCCAGCVTGFWKAPAAHLEKLQAAWKEQKPAERDKHEDGHQGHGDDHEHDHDHDHDH